MRKLHRWLLVVVIAIFAVFGVLLHFAPANAPTLEDAREQLSIGTSTFSVELAENDITRTKGLSGHAPLGENDGMLFIFPSPGRYQFWMKDMLFDLDMIWIGPDWKIVDITANATASSYPDTKFQPKQDAIAVLEVNAFSATRRGLKIGDAVLFERNK
jgi:uncharacterized membrane protein (UPF0127 family)